jgi:hypothetical protein
LAEFEPKLSESHFMEFLKQQQLSQKLLVLMLPQVPGYFIVFT